MYETMYENVIRDEYERWAAFVRQLVQFASELGVDVASVPAYSHAVIERDRYAALV